VVHTATAAKHIDLLLTRAVSEGFLDVESMFAGRDGVAASYGCGGAADLLGCLSWASRNFGQHDAPRLVLRGCDVVPGWFEIGAEGVALTLGDTAPWTRAVLYQFSAVPRVPTDADPMMFEGADIALFSWVLSILAEEGILADVWRRIVARLRPASRQGLRKPLGLDLGRLPCMARGRGADQSLWLGSCGRIARAARSSSLSCFS